MKIAYCQISTHPSFVGAYGSYCKEPLFDTSGPLLTSFSEQPIKNICGKIEEKYNLTIKTKIAEILKSLSGKGIECLVFPEYSIPATSLEQLYKFAQQEQCICIGASHTVQGIYSEIYKSINLEINSDIHLGMSCCPIILPSNKTIPVFKKYKSKWESNMNTDNEEYPINQGIVYIPYKDNEQIAIVVCIDALKIDVDQTKANIIIVPAATPSIGQFKNKFESYLSRDIPTVFCNYYLYGGSTIYCHVPRESNIPFADTTRLVETGKGEEVVLIVDVDINSHTLVVKSANTKCLVNVEAIIPIYHRDTSNNLELLSTLTSNNNISDLDNISSLLDFGCEGILAQYKNFLQENISNRSMALERIQSWLQYIFINDFSFQQYERNWIEKTLILIQEYLFNGTMTVNEKVLQTQKRLYEMNTNLAKSRISKVDLPVFDDNSSEDSSFQNRGGETQQFKIIFQETRKSIFLLNSFKSMGKSAFVNRLKYLYSFNTIEKVLPKSAGFESFLRVLCDITNQPLSWDTLDDKEIEKLAEQFAQKISKMNKVIIVIKNTGNIFDDYNLHRTTKFVNCLADNLSRLNTHIKLIMEISRKIPVSLSSNANIFTCKLKPLLPLYIERLIEQITTKITYDISLPRIPQEVINACNGNPSIAKLIGVYLGKKINERNDSSLVLNEINDFATKHVDGILDNLQITQSEKEFLQEISIFRIPVKKYAFEMFQSYTKQIFITLQDNMIIESNNDYYSINTLINSRFKGTKLSAELHSLAASYYDKEFSEQHSSVDKAEYFYHISFYNPSLHKKELRYFSEDILAAAIALCDDVQRGNMMRINIALSHLESIKPWKERYWKYHLYVAYCKILLDDYTGYDDAFNLAISSKNDKTEIVYFLMAKKLIKSRKQSEAETILNTIEDKFGRSRQLSALWVMLRYSNNNTKREAIQLALSIVKESQYDLYASQLLVPILLHEGLKTEALAEIETVLSVWRNNEWANNMKNRIQKGTYDVVFEEDDEDEDKC